MENNDPIKERLLTQVSFKTGFFSKTLKVIFIQSDLSVIQQHESTMTTENAIPSLQFLVA